MRPLPLLAGLILSGTVAAQTPGQDSAAEKAAGISDLVFQKTGTAQALNTNVITPMSTKQQLSTVDGTKNFDAQIACKASNQFLRMRIQPQNTGDIKILTIEQDTTLDGKIDSYITPPWLVSGVCSNGFVQCNPGTWENCSSYKWAVSDDDIVSADRTAFSDLGGCYCINNNCGTGLAWSNIKGVLGHLGGGAVAALSKANPFYGISDIEFNETSVTYLGQNSSNCTSANIDSLVGTGSTQDLTKYQHDPSKIKSDAFSAGDTNKLANLIKTSNLNAGSDTEFQSCTITRNVPIEAVGVEDVIGFDSGSGGVAKCGSDCLQLTLGRVGDNYWRASCAIFEEHSRFFVKKPERIISATLKHAQFDDWIQVKANGEYVWSGPYDNWTSDGQQPGACELNTSWSVDPNKDFTSHIKKSGPVEFRIRVAVGGLGEGYALGMIKVDTSCKVLPDDIIDTCHAYQNDPDCELVEDVVDGVSVYRDFARTGLSALASKKTINVSHCSVPQTRPWWKKERRYQCKKKTPYNFDAALERKAYVESNTNNNSYKDVMIDPKTGQKRYGSGSFTLTTPFKPGECQNFCQTRKPHPKHDAATSGVTGSKSDDPLAYDFYYRQCGTDNICPAGDGEEVMKSCQCLNEFAEATAIMATVRSAAQDLICSSGKEATLD